MLKTVHKGRGLFSSIPSLTVIRHLSAFSSKKAVIFDLGGVVFDSPFAAFTEFEKKNDLPALFITEVIKKNGNDGAFSQLEKGVLELNDFYPKFDAECKASGHALDSKDLFKYVSATLKYPNESMIDAITVLRAKGIAVAALTNNWKASGKSTLPSSLYKHFDVVVESAAEGLRKPDPKIYELVCQKLGKEPSECVFLDDIGGNLKPARKMGMTTIKVENKKDGVEEALNELSSVTGLVLNDDLEGFQDVRKGFQIDLKALGKYMKSLPNMPSHIDRLKVIQFSHGQSNPTYLVQSIKGNHSFVLRKKPPGKLLKGAHAIEREYQVISALQGVAPVPKLFCLEEDESIIGTPFYLMEYCDGDLYLDVSLPTRSPSSRKVIYDNLISALAKIHSLDVKKNLPTYGKMDGFYTRQLKTWSRQSISAVTPTDQFPDLSQHPAMEELIETLPTLIPESSLEPALVHGDFRLDNCIFDKETGEVKAVLDWELSTLGDPMADLAYACMGYHLMPGEVLPGLNMGLKGTNIEGVPKEKEFIEMYCAKRNLDPDPIIKNWNFYHSFGFFRLAAIIQGVYRRGLSGQASGKGHSNTEMMIDVFARTSLNFMHQHMNRIDPFNPPVVKMPKATRSTLRIPKRRIHTTRQNLSQPPSIFGELSPRAQSLLDEVKVFMDENVYPNEHEFDNHQFDDVQKYKVHPLMEELKAKAKSQGLWNLFMPLESDPDMRYGAGLTNFEYAFLCEQMGRSMWAPEVFNCSAPDTGNMEVLNRYCTEEQKEKWLIPLLNGEIRSCFGMTEPGVASSDATNITSVIEADGDDYVINGQKHWTSGAYDPRTKIMIFMGKTDINQKTYRQQSMILVPMDTPGITLIKPLRVFGYDDLPHGHAEISFENVRVPKANVILGEGRGFEIAQGRLGPGRIHHCMRLIGSAQRGLEYMIKRSKERRAFGKTLAEHETVQSSIAESAIEIEQTRLLTLQAAMTMDKYGNKVAKKEIAMIKAAAPLMACRVLDRSMQVHGGLGLSTAFPMAQAYSWARALRLADGPDEVHLQAIAKILLKEH